MTLVAAPNRRITKDQERPHGVRRMEASLMDGIERVEPDMFLNHTVLPFHVKRALDYMRVHMAEKISLSDVVLACATSERTLLKQFRKCVGLSPLAYLNRHRLNAARRELQREGSDEAISDIAIRCGCPHVGRFAGGYRRLFGESPSATRQRARLRGAPSPPHSNGEACSRSPITAAWRERPSLLIVPLRTETRQESLEAQDLTEQLAARLSRVRIASVALAHPSRPVSVHEAQLRNAGAQYCLRGRLKRHGQRVRVIVRLIDVATDRHLWGDSFDGLADSPLELHDRVADAVLCGVASNITDAEIARAHGKDPSDLKAAEIKLQALRLILNSDTASAHQAIAVLSRAVDMDPADGVSVGLLAYSHLEVLGYYGTVSPRATLDTALRLSQHAGLLDNDDPLVLVARAGVAGWMMQSDEADALLDRALAIDPTSAWAWERRAYARLSGPEDSRRAIADFQHALRLRGPGISRSNCFLGIACAHFKAGRLQDAGRWLRKALSENPRADWMHRTISCLALKTGDDRANVQSVDRLRRVFPHLTLSYHADFPFYDPRWLEGLANAGMPR